MSDPPVTSGLCVTRDDFSRLETKVDEVLQLIKGQISLWSSRSTSSQGPEEGVYDSVEDPIFKKQDGATGWGKDINSQDKIHDEDEGDEESFIVLDPSSKREESQTLVKEPVDRYTSLPNITTEATKGNTQSSHMTVDYQVKQLNQRVELLSDQLNVSVKEVISEYQKSIQEIKGTASFYQAEMQETVKRQKKSLEDIQDMTGRLSNQLNTVVEETRDVRRHLDDAINDVLQNLQTSQSSEKKVTNMSTENNEELKDEIKDVVQSAESSIKANIRAELVWFKEHIDETVKSQVCQVLDEVKNTSQDTEKRTAAISQEFHASSKSVVQEIQTSVTVTGKHVDKILEEVKSSNIALSEEMSKSTETITQNIIISKGTLTQDIQASATSVREKIDQSIDGVTTNVSDSVGKSIKQAGDEMQKTVQSHGETMKANIDSVREAVESHDEKMETKTAEIQNIVESHNEKMETKTAKIQKTVESHNEKMETKAAEIQKTVENHNEKMETKAAEIQRAVESHNEKMETKTAEIHKAVESHDEKMETKTAEIHKAVESHDEKMETKTAEIHKAVESHNEKMETKTAEIQKAVESHNEKMETKTAEIHKAVESHNEKMETKTAEIHKAVESHNEKMETKTAEIHKAVESHNEKMETKTAEIHKAVESHNEKMETKTAETQKTVESHGEKMKENLQDSLNQQSQNTRTHVDTKMTENTKQLKDDMYQLKREIFAFTEKECQIVRDRIEGPLPSHKLYTLDFYVKNFKDLIKSGVDRHNPPWHINHFKSSILGWVRFLHNGKLNVWLSYGRHPREVGLQPLQSGSLKIKATISDTSGKLADMEVGEKTVDFNEDRVKSNNDWGYDLGEIDCQSILDAGYADKPGYGNGAVLVRYLVEVL